MLYIARLFLLVILVAFSFSGYAKASELSTILDQIIQAYGGEQNLRKMDNMTQRWDFVALMGKRHGTDTRHILSPDKLRVDLNYPEKAETRILNGDIAQTVFNGASPVMVNGREIQFLTEYSDFAFVEGVLVHRKENKFAHGRLPQVA